MKSLMIFAAGLGTRMRPLTDDRPKPMVHVAGRPMIDFLLEHAEGAGIDKVLVNTHYLPEQIEDHLAHSNVQIQREKHLLDTGGGLKRAAPLLANPTFTINSDAVWTDRNPLIQLSEDWRDDDDCLMLLARRESGNFSMDKGGHLIRGGPFMYTGAQIIRTEHVQMFPESVFSLNLVWDHLIASGKLRGVEFTGRWCDVGTPDAIPGAEAMLAK